MTDQPLRVGGVPEHFNLPFRDLADERPDLLAWEDVPSGTGAMCRALEDKTLDVAVLLTEGIVQHVHRGGSARIVGTFTATPLVWGVHVRADGPLLTEALLEGVRYGISRPGSGSHLMARLDAAQRGWGDPEFVVVGGFDGARKAFREDRIDAFMHEKTMALPLVAAGEWRRVSEFSGPWPAFLVAAGERTCRESLDAVDALLSAVGEAAAKRSREVGETVGTIVDRFGLQAKDVREWLAATRWDSRSTVSASMLEETVDTLRRHGIVDESLPPEGLVSSSARLRA